MKKNLLPIFFLLISCTFSFTQGNSGTSQNKNSGKLDKESLQVFPNPADNFIGISTNDLVKRIAVFNLVGHEMKTFTANKGQKYYVGDLPKGIYLVQLLGHEGKVLKTQRVSKR